MRAVIRFSGQQGGQAGDELVQAKEEQGEGGQKAEGAVKTGANLPGFAEEDDEQNQAGDKGEIKPQQKGDGLRR